MIKLGENDINTNRGGLQKPPHFRNFLSVIFHDKVKGSHPYQRIPASGCILNSGFSFILIICLHYFLFTGHTTLRGDISVNKGSASSWIWRFLAHSLNHIKMSKFPQLGRAGGQEQRGSLGLTLGSSEPQTGDVGYR